MSQFFKYFENCISKLQNSFFITICILCCAVLYLVAQLCLTLSDPMDCSPPGCSVHLDSPDKNTGVGCHALLQRIFPIQGLNPGLLHCRQILYHLNHQESPLCAPVLTYLAAGLITIVFQNTDEHK